MLKDRGEPVALCGCSMKHAHGAWNCGVPNRCVSKLGHFGSHKKLTIN